MRVNTTIMRTRIFQLAVAACLAVALGAPVAAQIPQSIAIGPYVQNVGTDNATICWATLAGELNYAPAGSAARVVRSYDHHSITLRGLQPGTTYTYDVLGDGTNAGKGSFTTFPAGEQAFSFVVMGDTQGDQKAHRRVVERIIADKPDLVLHIGDLTDDGREIALWETFFRVGADLVRSVPYFTVLGNHEKDSPLYVDFFALPGNERYYSFDRGAAHFVVLDIFGPYAPLLGGDNQPLTASHRERIRRSMDDYWQRQREWVADDLAGHQGAKYLFVFLHTPLYSVRASCQEEARQVRERLGTIFQDYHVSAVFAGHDHHYHRAIAGGVQFITVSPAGGTVRDIEMPQPETVKYMKTSGFVHVDVGLERTWLRAMDIDGRVIEELELSPRAISAEGHAAPMPGS